MTIIERLQEFSDKELREELKRRAYERKHSEPAVLRCRNCQYCAVGMVHKSQIYPTTIVCKAKPKPKNGENRYYATNPTQKACEQFKRIADE